MKMKASLCLDIGTSSCLPKEGEVIFKRIVYGAFFQ